MLVFTGLSYALFMMWRIVLTITNTRSVRVHFLRRLVGTLGASLVEWASREAPPVRPRASARDPREVFRRQQIRHEAQQRREEVLLRVLTGPRQF